MAEILPVAVDMASAKGEAVVYQSGVDHDVFLCTIQQVIEVAKVSEATSNTVPGTILVQHKYLTRTEPALKLHKHIDDCYHTSLWKFHGS